MNMENIASANSEKLVEEFIRIGLLMYGAVEYDEHDVYNNHFGHMTKLEAELKSRPGDQRHLFLPLLIHENPQVRLNAIKSTLALEPQIARKALEELAISDEIPYDSEAKSTIRHLDSGFWVPD